MIETHRPQPASSSRPFGWARRRAHELGAIAALAAFVGLGVLTYNAATQTSAEQLVAAERQARLELAANDLRRDLAQCDRANRVRGFDRWIVRRLVLSGNLPRAALLRVRENYPITDCEATIRLARTVPLPVVEQLAIERAVRRTLDGHDRGAG